MSLLPSDELDDRRAHEFEYAELMLLKSALEGLEDVAAGRVLSEAELDQALGSRRLGEGITAPARPSTP